MAEQGDVAGAAAAQGDATAHGDATEQGDPAEQGAAAAQGEAAEQGEAAQGEAAEQGDGVAPELWVAAGTATGTRWAKWSAAMAEVATTKAVPKRSVLRLLILI